MHACLAARNRAWNHSTEYSVPVPVVRLAWHQNNISMCLCEYECRHFKFFALFGQQFCGFMFLLAWYWHVYACMHRICHTRRCSSCLTTWTSSARTGSRWQPKLLPCGQISSLRTLLAQTPNSQQSVLRSLPLLTQWARGLPGNISFGVYLRAGCMAHESGVAK